MNSLNSFPTDDASIIDISNNIAEDIPTNDLYISVEVPFWKPNRKSRNICCENANQALFLDNFKNSFYANKFYDLRGYMNYALILINKIDEDFKSNNDFSLFQERINNIIHYYPQIETQVQLCFKEAIFYKRDSVSVSIFLKKCPKGNTHRKYSSENEKLGNIFNKKLDLSLDEAAILNELNYYNSVFFDINLYKEEILKVFIYLLRQFEKCFSDGFDKVSIGFAKKFKVDKFEIYKWILIQCENLIAQIYGYEKEIRLTNFYAYRQGPFEKFENEVILPTKQLIAEYMVSWVRVEEDEKTLELIYAISKNRLKLQINYLGNRCLNHIEDFIFEVVTLSYFNRNNPYYYNIFFDVFKEVANKNNIIALKVYLHYTYHQLSYTIPTKIIPVNIKAKLFAQQSQELIFDEIVKTLLLEKDLPKALSAFDEIANTLLLEKSLPKAISAFDEIANTLLLEKSLPKALSSIDDIYITKRKKILRAMTNIRVEEEKNIATLGLLNEYLQDPRDLDKQMPLPKVAMDLKLLVQKTNQWKIKFEELATNYNGNPTEFTDSVIALGNLNFRNYSVENMFFEASKFISIYDKEKSLYLYIYYLNYNLKSETSENKQLIKTIQKDLFKTEEQLKEFEVIVKDFINDKDLNKALSRIPTVYITKRKKIKLDDEIIKQVQKQHSNTVELLNEYLRDGSEDTADTRIEESTNTEIELIVSQIKTQINQSIFLEELSLNPIQTKTLELFANNNFVIKQSEIEAFAKSNGVFKNQLIDSINDSCYEYFDDLLIEEADYNYTIDTTYYQRILTR